MTLFTPVGIKEFQFSSVIHAPIDERIQQGGSNICKYLVKKKNLEQLGYLDSISMF